MVHRLAKIRNALAGFARWLESDSPRVNAHQLPWLAVVLFVYQAFARAAIHFLIFLLEIPIHLSCYPTSCFTALSARKENGEYLDSYSRHLQRHQLSIATSLALLLLVAAQGFLFILGLVRLSQPMPAVAYTTSTTLNPTWDITAQQLQQFVDDGFGGCTMGSATYQCASAAATSISYSGTIGSVDCSLGGYTDTYNRLAMKFDLSSIPNNATITNSQLTVNVANASAQLVTIGRLSTDTPDSQSCTTSQLYDAIGAVTSYTTATWSTTGSKTIDLDTTADSDIQSRLTGSDLIALGITAGNGDLGSINSTDSASNKPQLIVTYTLPPQAPTNSGHGTITTSSIAWTWTDNATADTSNVIHDAAHAVKCTAGAISGTGSTGSCTENGLAANTQYARHPNVIDANGNTDGPSTSAYSAIDTPSGLSFSSVTTTGMTAAATGTLSNLTSGSSGLFFQESVTATNSNWTQTNAWAKSGLTANTQYSFQVKARNGDAAETSLTAAAAKYTLSLAPNVVSARTTSTWYASNPFPFTNAAGWGSGGVQYYRYVWDQNATHTFSGSESAWSDANANCPAGSCSDAGTTLNKTATADGNSWYLHAQSFNGDNEANGSGTDYGPYFFDATNPTAPTTVNDGTGSDITWTSATTELSANWTSSTDAASGLQKYQYAIGTTAGGTDVSGYTDNGTNTTVTRTGLTLSDGTTYYVSVRAVDNAGNTGSATSSNGVTVDSTAPGAPATVNDGLGTDQSFTTSTTELSANWTAVTDGASGLGKYQYAIGTTSGGTEVVGYTDNGTATTVTRTGLSLSNGITYYVAVRAVDNAGNTGLSRSSNGITVNTAAPTITDNQTGDAAPRNSAGTVYNVDFARSAAGPTLDSAQYAVYSGAGKTGTVLKDWTDIFTVDTDSYTTDWPVDFGSLQEGLNYVSVRVFAVDGLSSELDDVFLILKDTQAPILTSIAASVSSSTAVISWTTSEVADSRISYGLTTTYTTNVPVDSTPVLQHRVEIASLTSGTTYHYQVTSADPAGNSTFSVDQTFTTTAEATPSPTTSPSRLPTPTLVSPANGQLVLNARPLFTGNALSGNTIFLVLDGRLEQTFKTSNDPSGVGSYAYRLRRDLGFGYHTYSIQARNDATGKTSRPSAPRTFVTFPDVPATIVQPTQSATTARDVTVTGVAWSNYDVFVFIDGDLAGVVKASLDHSGVGDFAFAVRSLEAGQHTVHVRLRGPDGKVGLATHPRSFTVSAASPP